MRKVLKSIWGFISDYLCAIIFLGVLLTGGILLSRYIVKVTDITGEVKIAERILKMDSIEEMETFLQKEGLSYSIDNQKNISIDVKGLYELSYIFSSDKFIFDQQGTIYNAVVFKRHMETMKKDDFDIMKKIYNKDGTVTYTRGVRGDDNYLKIIINTEGGKKYISSDFKIEEQNENMTACKDKRDRFGFLLILLLVFILICIIFLWILT